ncbi:hypothetical protein B0H16DRAFT_1694792 [Mycena metata]|uniref:Uncharacterized protein n=1 Tax=Mycena metata TaxID=1033252 RepID=A0AAD7MYZ9_9AGAR|nr:hypothetical protein B0H16DRAFT_1694792 [Mycena metata]
MPAHRNGYPTRRSSPPRRIGPVKDPLFTCEPLDSVLARKRSSRRAECAADAHRSVDFNPRHECADIRPEFADSVFPDVASPRPVFLSDAGRISSGAHWGPSPENPDWFLAPQSMGPTASHQFASAETSWIKYEIPGRAVRSSFDSGALSVLLPSAALAPMSTVLGMSLPPLANDTPLPAEWVYFAKLGQDRFGAPRLLGHVQSGSSSTSAALGHAAGEEENEDDEWGQQAQRGDL